GAAINNYGTLRAEHAPGRVVTIRGAGGGEVVNNYGSLVQDGGSTYFEVRFNNSGAVEVLDGAVALSDGGTSSGSFTGAAGTTLFFSGAHSLTADSQVVSAGAVV